MKPMVSRKLKEKEAISFYKLPICDVQKERRNFDGLNEYTGIEPYWDTEGTTDTDYETHGAQKETKKLSYSRVEPSRGYTKIYRDKRTKAQKGR